MVLCVQCFGPLALFHVEGKEAIEERATSIQNAAESCMVLAIYQELRARYSHLSSSNQIAVITPYKAQVLHGPGLLPTRFPARPLTRASVPMSWTVISLISIHCMLSFTVALSALM